MFNKRWCTEADAFCKVRRFTESPEGTAASFLYTTDSSKLNQLSGFGLPALTIEFECLEHCINADFIPILETIRQRFLGTVNPNRRVLD